MALFSGDETAGIFYSARGDVSARRARRSLAIPVVGLGFYGERFAGDSA
jgi:hypothetical protein